MFGAAAVALLALLAAACAVPAPKQGETVPHSWGPAPAQVRDVAYGPLPEQRADIYKATRGGNRGVIVLVHGGSFTGGNRDEVVRNSGLVMRQTHRGFAVVAISYRLANSNQNAFPAAVRDVDTAVNWVRNHGRSHGLNPHTVVVVGHSAGGTLASLVGVGHNSNPTGALGRTAKVDGWVSFAGIMDFSQARTRHFGEGWLRHKAQPAWMNAASPVNHLDRNDPPGYVVHGVNDGVVPPDQLNIMTARAGQLGIGGRLYYDTSRANNGWAGHLPQGGANASIFNYWLDRVVERAL